MYRRPILCTLYGAVDFLTVLMIAVVGGGGGCYWYIVSDIYYVPVDDGWDQVLDIMYDIMSQYFTLDTNIKFTSTGDRTRVACVTDGHST